MKPSSLLCCWLLVWTYSLLTACATLPPELQSMEVEPVTLAQAREDPQGYMGRLVRWGGTILAIENEPRETWLQVLAKPLDRTGRPQEDAPPEGRFLVQTQEFLDPAIYTQGREITVLGTLAELKERTVGKRTIQIPVIQAKQWLLWPKRKSVEPVIYPYWWYDPWWYYYPWGPYWW